MSTYQHQRNGDFASFTLTSGRRDFISLVNLSLEAESILWEMYKEG